MGTVRTKRAHKLKKAHDSADGPCEILPSGKQIPNIIDKETRLLPVRVVNEGDECVQTWDSTLDDCLKAIGKKYGVEDYDPVIAIAEIALDPDNEVRDRLKAHTEVAKYVRIKRQLEPVINQTNITINQGMAPEKRDDRIRELQALLSTSGDNQILEHE